MDEVEFLYTEYGVTRFFFIASELNVTGSEFPMEIANRILRLSEAKRRKFSWTGFLLPTFNKKDEIELLSRSGYSWSSQVLRRSDHVLRRLPHHRHRAAHLIRHCRLQVPSYGREPQLQSSLRWYQNQRQKRLRGIFAQRYGPSSHNPSSFSDRKLIQPDPFRYSHRRGLKPGPDRWLHFQQRLFKVFHLDHAHVQTLMYLKLSVAGHLTIFLTRTRGPFWSIKPAKILWIAVVGTQAIATLIAVYGVFMTPLGWG